MFNFNKKKTIIGVVGLVLSIVLAAVCGAFDVSGGIEALTPEQMAVRFFCVTGMALCLGFVMLILFDWKMFFILFAVTEVIVSLQFIVAVDVSVGRIILSLLCLGGLIFFFTTDYRNCKYGLNGATSARRQQKEQEQVEQLEKFTAEDNELKQSIKYIEKSLILSSRMGGLYQVIKSEEEYYFHYIGTVLKKMDLSKLITDFANIERYNHKKDFKIIKADISGLSVTIRSNPQFMDYGTLKIKLISKKTKSYGFINLLEAEELKTFFGEEIVITDKNAPDENEGNEDIDSGRKKVLNAINLTKFIFSIVAAVFFNAYIFYNTRQTDLAFTVLAIIFCLAPIVFYFVLQDYLSIRDVGRNSKRANDRIDFSFTIIIFPILFALKCLWSSSDIVDYQIWKLLLYSLIPLAILLAVFFIVGREFKKFKSCISIFLIAVIAFSPAFIYKANSAFDLTQPEEVACEVVEMPTHTDNSGNVTYYLVVKYGDKDIKTEVNEITYNESMVGGEVTLLRYNGAFGIRTVYLK